MNPVRPISREFWGFTPPFSHLAKTPPGEIFRREMELTDYFLKVIQKLDPEENFIRLAGKKSTDGRCAVVSVQIPGADMAQAAWELDSRYGIMTRVGLHCAPAAHKTLGTYPEGTIRFSFGPENTVEEADAALGALAEITGISRRKEF